MKPEEIEQSVGIEETPVKIEPISESTLDSDQPKSEKIKSQSVPKREQSIEVNTTGVKLENTTTLEEDKPAKDKIKPKSVKDKKKSLEVKKVEESEAADDLNEEKPKIVSFGKTLDK